jgi:anti-sigma B factor antagonist
MAPSSACGFRPLPLRTRNNSVVVSALQLTESEPHPGARVIAVSGELDLSVARQFGDALTRAVEGSGDVLVDLSACEFLDSTGLALLVNTRNDLGEQGRRLAVLAPSAQVARLLEVTGLQEEGFVFADLEEATARR